MPTAARGCSAPPSAPRPLRARRRRSPQSRRESVAGGASFCRSSAHRRLSSPPQRDHRACSAPDGEPGGPLRGRTHCPSSPRRVLRRDRKSTRLNSSHVATPYEATDFPYTTLFRSEPDDDDRRSRGENQSLAELRSAGRALIDVSRRLHSAIIVRALLLTASREGR